jgi:phosphoribosylanthranilate isomerase
MVRVKICGLTGPDDLVHALNEGADAVGFVLEPSSTRYVGKHHYDIYFKLCGPYVATVAVFGHANRSVPESSTIQAISFDGYALPGQRLVQTIRIRRGDTASDLPVVLPGVETVLLDAYSERGFGGTGKKVDWRFAGELVEDFSRRGIYVVLSGGLTPDNVAEAIRQVNPYAVDVSSGVESSPGKKDPSKVRDFIQAAKSVRAER